MASVWAWVYFMFCIIESVVAIQFTVGGSNGWAVPSGSDKDTYNKWAARNRFQIGDTLLFKYDKREDSVLQVTQGSYNTCNTSGPIAAHTDGNTVLKFPVHGPFYFISGNQSRCQLGEKLVVVVLASTTVSPAPAESPTTATVLSPSPTAAGPAPATSPTMGSPSPSPSMPSPALSPSSPSPSPIIASSPSPSPSPSFSTPSSSSPTPQVATSPTVPAAAGGSFPPSASIPPPNISPSPSISSNTSSTAFSTMLNFLIPLFFAALLSVRIATI